MEITNKHICSGCHACYNICPVHCITMEYDSEGFLYPHIDREKCVKCGRCKNVCPVLKEYKANMKGQAYACVNKNENIRMQSSSGGVFTLLAEEILDGGGVVYGAAFDESFNVQHIEVSDKSDLDKLRGSKYVQSQIGNTYSSVKERLEQGQRVLFSGTPCQISGLKSFLNRDYDNLIMVDIVCHGVPSPKVWQKYIEYKTQKNENRLHSVNFRDKKTGWKQYSVFVKFNNGIEYTNMSSKDLYMKAFIGNLCLRPSCYNCHSKSLERESDITLADFWGVENVVPEMFDNKGTSLVFTNSEKGRSLFKKISDMMIYKEVDINEAVKYNPSAYKSCELTPKRQKFMDAVDNTDFKKNTERYIKKNIIHRCAGRIKRIIKRMWKYVH